MKTSDPPVFMIWLLERLSLRQHRDAMIGDLREQFHNGRSAWWFRRQVLMILLAGVAADIRAHWLLAVRAFIMACAAFLLLAACSAALRYAVVVHGEIFGTPQPEILRQAVVYYALPFEIVTCLGFAVTGWLIATWHRDARVGVVIVSALAPWLWAFPWASETGRLLHAGLWPFWDFRLALLFKAALLFVGYPLCILIGGFWSTRFDAVTG